MVVPDPTNGEGSIWRGVVSVSFRVFETRDKSTERLGLLLGSGTDNSDPTRLCRNGGGVGLRPTTGSSGGGEVTLHLVYGSDWISRKEAGARAGYVRVRRGLGGLTNTNFPWREGWRVCSRSQPFLFRVDEVAFYFSCQPATPRVRSFMRTRAPAVLDVKGRRRRFAGELDAESGHRKITKRPTLARSKGSNKCTFLLFSFSKKENDICWHLGFSTFQTQLLWGLCFHYG